MPSLSLSLLGFEGGRVLTGAPFGVDISWAVKSPVKLHLGRDVLHLLVLSLPDDVTVLYDAAVGCVG